MQVFQRIVRDVLVMTAVGATAAAPADSLVGHASFEEVADATLEEFMPWGAFGGGVLSEVLGEFGDDPLSEPQPTLPAAGDAGTQGGPQVLLLSEFAFPDPTSCALLLGGLAGWALWRRRVQRRRHAGGIGAYMI
ncbi:MAG: hypothetical protein EPO12_22500 [Aquabacterium sp.]|jgi:hypothetical protein|nr:MAG: hypothetical protein EPO12_22500 [Aquabacterium sp.]